MLLCPLCVFERKKEGEGMWQLQAQMIGPYGGPEKWGTGKRHSHLATRQSWKQLQPQKQEEEEAQYSIGPHNPQITAFQRPHSPKKCSEISSGKAAPFSASKRSKKMYCTYHECLAMYFPVKGSAVNCWCDQTSLRKKRAAYTFRSKGTIDLEVSEKCF